MNKKLILSILIFTVVNLLFSYWYLNSSDRMVTVGYAAAAYGFLIGILVLPFKTESIIKSIFIGFIFFLIFYISSFSMMALSKKVFNTDDFTPVLSSIFSVFFILITLDNFIKINKRTKLALLMIFNGTTATYLSSYILEIDNFTILHSLITIPFLWQMGTGIPLLISLNSNRK